MKNNLKKILKILDQHKDELRKKFGITSIKIFGSYAKGIQKKDSDVDLIVGFKKLPGFIKLMKIEKELSKLLGIKVDLLTEEGISPYIKEYIEKEEIILL